MVIKVAEAYSSGNIVAVRTESGSFNYYTSVEMTIGGTSVKDIPVVSREISTLNVEMALLIREQGNARVR